MINSLSSVSLSNFISSSPSINSELLSSRSRSFCRMSKIFNRCVDRQLLVNPLILKCTLSSHASEMYSLSWM